MADSCNGCAKFRRGSLHWSALRSDPYACVDVECSEEHSTKCPEREKEHWSAMKSTSITVVS